MNENELNSEILDYNYLSRHKVYIWKNKIKYFAGHIIFNKIECFSRWHIQFKISYQLQKCFIRKYVSSKISDKGFFIMISILEDNQYKNIILRNKIMDFFEIDNCPYYKGLTNNLSI